MIRGAAIRAFIATTPAAGRRADGGRVVSLPGRRATILLATDYAVPGRIEASVVESPRTARVRHRRTAPAGAVATERW